MSFFAGLLIASAHFRRVQATITSLDEACSIIGSAGDDAICLIGGDYRKPKLLIVDERNHTVTRRVPLAIYSNARSVLGQADRFTQRLGIADETIPKSDRREIERDLAEHQLTWAPIEKSYAGIKGRGVFVYTESAPPGFDGTGLFAIAYEGDPDKYELAKKGVMEMAVGEEYLCWVPADKSSVKCLAKIMRIYYDLSVETDCGSIYLWPNEQKLSFAVGRKLYTISLDGIIIR